MTAKKTREVPSAVLRAAIAHLCDADQARAQAHDQLLKLMQADGLSECIWGTVRVVIVTDGKDQWIRVKSGR